jgi:branched-subunit amino acid aminotransferase/4-amino-4-deoxychorismate lyase
LKRLRQSAEAYGIEIHEDQLPTERAIADWVGRSNVVVRLNVGQTKPGQRARVWMIVRPLPIEQATARLLVANRRVSRADDLAMHKSMNYLGRHLAYEEALAKGYDDAILLSPEGEVLETAHGNLFVNQRGEWITPPAEGGLLAGTLRSALLQDSVLGAMERQITIDDLTSAEAVAVTNSVRGVQEVVEIASRHKRSTRSVQDLIDASARTWPAP